jgi:pantoate--beta-alanine ligase
MERLVTIAEVKRYVRAEKAAGRTVAFVPTMGALHAGHGSCVEVAKKRAESVVVSIFVNPTQFGPAEDLSKYPRPLEKDLALCEAWGAGAVFVPEPGEMYPAPQEVWVEAERLSKGLCGRSRTKHFRGVATVVLKLFHIVEPDIAVFGQKDAQQAVVIRAMTEQLNVPVEIALSATAREPDGLALSSRNAYLCAEERKRAPWIHRALQRGRAIAALGERDASVVAAAVRREMETHGIGDIEYVEIVGARDLAPLGRLEGRVLIAVAARVGTTRLIDNIVIAATPGGAVEEASLF